MKIKTISLLATNTRVLLKEEVRKRLFSDKKSIAQKLKISLTQVHSWKSGVNNPSIGQLQALRIDLDEIWDSVESFNLERGICKIK
jgi:transcriptional regulator with XRE-family HTH domain